MTKELKTTYEINGEEITLSDGAVRKYLARTSKKSNATISDQEIVMFLQLCRYQKLNPYLNEAYLVKMSSDYPATIITSKDVFIKRAAKNPNYNGKKAGIVVLNSDGEHIKKESGIVGKDEKIAGGWCEVYRKDYEHPISIEVDFNEYAKTSKGSLVGNWANMPATMIRKVAVAQALREAFPDDFAGLYVAEEMEATQEKQINPEPEKNCDDFDKLLFNKQEDKPVTIPVTPDEPVVDTSSDAAKEFFGDDEQ